MNSKSVKIGIINKIILFFIVGFLVISGAYAGMKYIGPDLPEGEHHPYFKGLDLMKTEEGKIARVRALLILPEKYVKIYEKKWGEDFDILGIEEDISPDEAMKYIDNGCKLLEVWNSDDRDLLNINPFERNSVYSSTLKRIKMYKDIRCGKKEYYSSQRGRLWGISFYHREEKERKPLSDIIYNK